MESAVQSAWAMSIGVMSLGPYLFLAVYVGIKIWARTKEKLAVQETLRRLIESGTPVTPEVIEALRPMRGRTPQEVARSVKRWRYWGVFTIGLGVVLSLLTLFAEEPRTTRGLTVILVLLLVIPGLFFLTQSIITQLVHRSRRQ